MSTYEDRKLGDRCCYGSCPKPKTDDSDYCAEHRDKRRERSKLAMRAIRKQKRKDRKCLWCPKKAMVGRWSCPACTIKVGDRLREVVTPIVSMKADRVRAVTEGDGRTRLRYIGQGKRGAQSVAANDTQDLADILKLTQRCKDGLAFMAAQLEIGRQQRKAGEHEALGFLHLAQRLIGDVLQRHRYVTPTAADGED